MFSELFRLIRAPSAAGDPGLRPGEEDPGTVYEGVFTELWPGRGLRPSASEADLGQASATVRARLHRLEHADYVRLGEDTTVELTEQGRKDAQQLYEQHAALRAE